MRCFSVRFKSTPAVSLRWSNVCSFAANQLPLPPIRVARLGIGHAFRMPTPFGLSRLTGMMLKPCGLLGVARERSCMHPAVLMIPDPGGISFPHCEDESDAGSATYTGILLPAEFLRVTKGLFGSSNSLKSPARILSVGTVSRPADPTEEPDSTKWYLSHSCPK